MGPFVGTPPSGVMIVASLMEKHVGLEDIGEGLSHVCFTQKMLGYFDENTLRIHDELGRF